jgi:hypothetical protein
MLELFETLVLLAETTCMLCSSSVSSIYALLSEDNGGRGQITPGQTSIPVSQNGITYLINWRTWRSMLGLTL